MIHYAQLRPGPGFQFSRALAYYAQRLITMPSIRRGVTRCLAVIVRLRHGTVLQDTIEPSVTRAASTLEKDGVARLANLLPLETLETMVAFFRDQPVIAPDGSLVPVDMLPSATGMAAYPLDTVVACPGLIEAVNSPTILGIVSLYLGCKPTLSSLGVRWSFPLASKRDETQVFHRDPDDWRFLKLFIYLSDVDQDAGPHVYVVGSNRTAGQVRARPYTRDSLEQRFGARNICSIEGPRGTTFIADTHGIHMGMPPIRTNRLILQAQYSILPIFAFSYEQATRPDNVVIDPYVNRLLVTAKCLTKN